MKTKWARLLAAAAVFFLFWLDSVSAVEKGGGETGEELSPKAIAEKELKELDLGGIRQFWEEIQREYGAFLPESKTGDVTDFIKSAGSFSFKDWGTGLLKYAFQELLINGRLLGSLLLLTIFSMFLQMLQNSFETASVSKIAYAIVFIVLLIIALNSFHIAVSYAEKAVGRMVHFTLAFIPLFLALMASGGAVVSAGFFHPVLLFMANVSGMFVQKIVFPLLFLSVLLNVVSTLTEHYKATQLAGLLRNWSIGLLGLFMTVFLGVISVQGGAAAVADGVAVRTAKFLTGNLIPVFGRMLTDAADTVIAASLLLKNMIGVAGVVMLLFSVLFPSVKILLIAFFYKLAASIMQPLGGGPIIGCLDIISKSVLYIFAALGIVSMMFFLSLTIIIIAGNMQVMIR
ncbi:MAG: stage III sporulation protein AE [Caldibacillus debilis]|uniref:Stage III sporulation protein AE n=1 Tax=Caldibacillus debilis TaxID=301148 RepID=A0A3E0K3A6_9BACI|nr:stage III sporulation protein AE [Caldibacillus debilis]REJ27199.1 MAG: stage III sporulation protein AE [Caldibacillus debilis]